MLLFAPFKPVQECVKDGSCAYTVILPGFNSPLYEQETKPHSHQTTHKYKA